MANGTATLDFGTQAAEANVDVGSQATIASDSKVEAFLQADNDTDRIDNIKIIAGTIVAGDKFTIYGEALEGYAHGTRSVRWVWI